uniref:Bug family tripartite tricarboxylate transporter substrate binding protein n=1 Tax=Pararhizobium sp. IMCC3301 TaxID=3067904 RepID=UPI0027423CC7|nr:tripartite tricarboxylate transporter substrate binding protein [Pararhizobium sp. IMCC3301]
MKHRLNRRSATQILAGTMIALAGFATAPALAEYPEKPINLVIGFSAGGGTDLTGRALAVHLRNVLGKPVVVVNKPGAASMIAAKFVADSRPDGYTLWYGSVGTMILARELEKSELGVDTDFVQAGTTTRLVPAIAVPVESPYQTLQDLLDDAKARPGELRWAHGGAGSAFMASGVGFIEANGLEVQAVPFSGTAKARLAIIGGQVDFGIQNMNASMNFGEKMRILGVLRGSKQELIDKSVPAAGELGIDYIAIDSPVGILAPAGTPEDVLKILASAVAEAETSDAYREAMEKLQFPIAVVPQSETAAQAGAILENVRRILPKLK